MKAQIFSIGTEILLGNITDTNSQYIAEKLSELGIDVYKMITIGDNEKRLYDALKEADGKSDYIFLSGGLGPTPDDITKDVVIKICDLEDEVEVDKKSYDLLVEYFADNEVALENNIKQAKFPKSAIVLDNPKGTAPGSIMESKNKTKFFLMPGPPNEMTYMFENQVKPHLVKSEIIKSKFIKTGLLGEWDVARRLDLDRVNPTISPYAKDEGVVLRVTSKAKTEEEADKEIEKGIDYVRSKIGKYIITTEDKPKEEVLVNLLADKNEKVSTAESITGGLIVSSIINAKGASEVLNEAFVVYSDLTKEKILGVSHETLEKYSAVSEETLLEMLDGLYNITNCELSLATTGYAHKGEVYIGIKYKDKYYVDKLQINGDRNRVRLRAKNRIIDMAILILRGQYENNISI